MLTTKKYLTLSAIAAATLMSGSALANIEANISVIDADQLTASKDVVVNVSFTNISFYHSFIQHKQGESARMSSFVGAIAIADMVKTTLGPKGMDKILQSVSDPSNMRITITNDGATILKAVPVENPAAKVLVDIARVQDDTVGDGTTR